MQIRGAYQQSNVRALYIENLISGDETRIEVLNGSKIETALSVAKCFWLSF